MDAQGTHNFCHVGGVLPGGDSDARGVAIRTFFLLFKQATGMRIGHLAPILWPRFCLWVWNSASSTCRSTCGSDDPNPLHTHNGELAYGNGRIWGVVGLLQYCAGWAQNRGDPPYPPVRPAGCVLPFCGLKQQTPFSLEDLLFSF